MYEEVRFSSNLQFTGCKKKIGYESILFLYRNRKITSFNNIQIYIIFLYQDTEQ